MCLWNINHDNVRQHHLRNTSNKINKNIVVFFVLDLSNTPKPACQKNQKQHNLFRCIEFGE